MSKVKNNNSVIYFKNLDGLRALAALSVVFFHLSLRFRYPNTHFYELLNFTFKFGGDGGSLGVWFFFILSGFLITYLLFDEKSKNGNVNILKFYMRRVLRIWPLYYLTLLIGFVIYPLILHFSGQLYSENASLFLYSIFATNFDHIYNGGPSNALLGVQWSVAIEEQFYLFWPLLFYAFCKKKYYPFILLFIIIISEYIYFQATDSYEDQYSNYYHLYTNLRFLALGALGAFICFYKINWVTFVFQKLNKLVHFLIYFFGFFMIFFHTRLSLKFDWFDEIYHFAPPLFFLFIIVEQNFSNNSFFKISYFKPLTWLGRISYGIYLLHMVAIYSVIALFPESVDYFWLKILTSIGLTILLSYLSHKYYESFFIKLKSKFSPLSFNEKIN